MSWRRVLKSVQTVSAHGFLFTFTLLLTLKLDRTIHYSWWAIFVPLWSFHTVVARGRFSLPAPSMPHDRHWAPFHAVMATPLLVAFELLLCIYLENRDAVNLKIVFLPLLAFETAILVDNVRMCRALMPGEDESMSDEALWETLPHFWVAISMVFFIAATIFTLLKLCGDVAALGWWDLFINYGVAECFAFLICTKWHNPAIHRRSNVRPASSSSTAGRYLNWHRGIVASSDEDYQQSRVCSLQDIGGHFMKIPLIGFQILLFMHLEGTPPSARHIPIPVLFAPLLLLQGAGVLFAMYRLLEKVIVLLHNDTGAGISSRMSAIVRDYLGFMHHGSRLLGWWPIDESSREDQARLYYPETSGMNSATANFIASRRMGLYEPIHPISMWGDFNSNGCSAASASTILQVETNLDNQPEDTSHGTFGTPNKYDQEASKPVDKVLRRLAQNREAARKSRLWKKAYVQQLENSKLRLMQLEQELNRARQQGLYAGGGLEVSQISCSGTLNSGTTFGVDYGHWVEVQNRQVNDLRNALQSHMSESELKLLVDGGVNHYLELFRMKEMAAKADVFYLISGMWKTPVERLFLWIGGFRPSDLLKVLSPHIEPLAEYQGLHVYQLTLACQQAEDALSQGMEKLLCYLGQSLADSHLGEGDYAPLAQLDAALENLAPLERFAKQADHFRQVTLQQMHALLTTHQAARGLVALGEYFERLRTLSSYWASQSTEAA